MRTWVRKSASSVCTSGRQILRSQHGLMLQMAGSRSPQSSSCTSWCRNLKGSALEEIDWMYANGIPVSLTACIANGLIGSSYLPDPPNGLLQGAGSHKERHRCLEDRREGRQRGGGRHWDAVARGRESHGMDSDTQQVRVNRGIRTSAYRGPAGGDSWVCFT